MIFLNSCDNANSTATSAEAVFRIDLKPPSQTLDSKVLYMLAHVRIVL